MFTGRLVVIFLVSVAAVFFINIGSMVQWEYFPNAAVSFFLSRHYNIFSNLYGLVAVLAVAIFIGRTFFRYRSVHLIVCLEICFGFLLAATVWANFTKKDVLATAKIGQQEFVFSSALNPTLGTFTQGSDALFEYRDDVPLKAVYFTPEDQHGFKALFSDIRYQSFSIGIHAPNSAELKCKPQGISICSDEGSHILEFYIADNYKIDPVKNRFSLFIDENLDAISKDIDALKVPSP